MEAQVVPFSAFWYLGDFSSDTETAGFCLTPYQEQTDSTLARLDIFHRPSCHVDQRWSQGQLQSYQSYPWPTRCSTVWAKVTFLTYLCCPNGKAHSPLQPSANAWKKYQWVVAKERSHGSYGHSLHITCYMGRYKVSKQLWWLWPLCLRMFASVGGHFGIDVALLLASNTYSEGCISTLVLARDSGE